MMDTYVYQAALWCEDCAKPIMAKLGQDPKFGSDHYPQGPYSDGGREADTPQHCDACHAFLENPLTQDGYQYVLEQLTDGRGNREVEALWLDFYGDDLLEDGRSLREHLKGDV